MTFRILARSLSGVLTFHNTEYRPTTGGVCVANHTTPIDVLILSTQSRFSLVSLEREQTLASLGTFFSGFVTMPCL